MTVKDFIHLVCQQRETSLKDLSSMMNVNYNTMSTTLSRNEGMGMTVDKLTKWVDELDMEIVIMDLNSDEEYVIDGDVENIPLHL